MSKPSSILGPEHMFNNTAFVILDSPDVWTAAEACGHLRDASPGNVLLGK